MERDRSHAAMERDRLYTAAMSGDTDAISKLRLYAGRLTAYERSILHIESMDGNAERVKFIVTQFADQNLLVKVDSGNETALHHAVYYGHTEVVKVLIDAAKNLPSTADAVAIDDDDGRYRMTCFEAFLRHANDSLNTALHVAVSIGNLDIVTLLVLADPNDGHVQNCNGETPIYLAAKLGYYEMVAEMCSKCKTPSLDGPQGTTALHAAILALPVTNAYMTNEFWTDEGQQMRSRCIEKIFGAASRSPQEDSSLETFFNKSNKNDKDTALHLAVRGNHMDVVKLILEYDPGYRRKSEVDEYGGVSKNRDLKTVIYMAANQGYTHRKMVKLLCMWYEYDNTFGHQGQIALHAAIIGRDPESAQGVLEDSKRLVTYRDDLGWTPLHYAAYYNSDEVLELIVKAQASIGYQSMDRDTVPTPLFIAVKEGHVFIVKQLMKMLPDSSCVALNREARNVLHLAVLQSDKKMIRCIVQYCPTKYIEKILNDKDLNGHTPIHLLIRDGCFVPELLKHENIKKKAVDKQGWVPLDMLYLQDEVVADQMLIKKTVNELDANMRWHKTWRRSLLRNFNGKASVVPLSKRFTKDAEFMRVEKNLMKQELERYTMRTNTPIIVTALITTVTFTVGFTMPGGYYQSGDYNEGMAILSNKKAFRIFVVADAVALVLSISSLFLYFVSSMYQDPYKVAKFNAASSGLNIISVIAMMLTFITGTYVVLSHSLALAITICVISCFFFLLIIGLLIKMMIDRKVERFVERFKV